MPEHAPLTPDEASITAKRILNDAGLIKGGADIAPSGTLRPTESQVDGLYVEDIIKPQIKEFLATTPEGKALNEVAYELSGFEAALGSAVGWTKMAGRPGIIPEGLNYGPSYEMRGNVMDYKDFAERNHLDVDFDLLGAPERNKRESYAEELLQRYFHKPLDNLVRDLIEHPEYRFGSAVNVMRSGDNKNPEYLEADWKIDSVLASGELRVASMENGRRISKPVTIAQLDTWNQTASQ